MFHHLVVFPYYRPYSKNSRLHDCQFLVIVLTWYNWDFLEIISSCVTNEHTIPRIWSVNVKKNAIVLCQRHNQTRVLHLTIFMLKCQTTFVICFFCEYFIAKVQSLLPNLACLFLLHRSLRIASLTDIIITWW